MSTTAHELARRLLAGPDHPVVLSIVAKYSDDVIESNCDASLDVDEALTDQHRKAGDDVILITGTECR